MSNTPQDQMIAYLVSEVKSLKEENKDLKEKNNKLQLKLNEAEMSEANYKRRYENLVGISLHGPYRGGQ